MYYSLLTELMVSYRLSLNGSEKQEHCMVSLFLHPFPPKKLA